MALIRKDIFNFNFFNYGQYYNGSYRGLRFRLGREPLENVVRADEAKRREGSMRAYVWPEPLSFDCTDPESIRFRDFEYSEEGLCEAIEWINEERNERS